MSRRYFNGWGGEALVAGYERCKSSRAVARLR